MKPSFQESLTKEFLLVDLVNNVDQLAESKQEVLARMTEKSRIVRLPATRTRHSQLWKCNSSAKTFQDIQIHRSQLSKFDMGAIINRHFLVFSR